MYCKHCGIKLGNRGKFCKKCGKLVSRRNWLVRNKAKLITLTPVAALFFVYLINTGALAEYIDIFPFWATNPKTTTLTCSYAGKSLKVEETYYGNINNYYANRNFLEKNNYIKDGKYDKFVYANPKDKTFKKLVQKIQSVAKINNLNSDQTLELTTCFVQNIQYDDAKANLVLKGSGNSAATEQYPYQTLYLDKGICTDKTYLGSVLVKELGYGTGLLAFGKQQHMALGIYAPSGYTSFNSRYVYSEMTTQTPIGLIPSDIDPNNGIPITLVQALKPLSEKDNPDTINFSDKTINNPDLVLDINTGGNYSRIVAVKNLETSIGNSIKLLSTQKENLQKAYSNIGYWNNRQAQAYSHYLSTPSTTQFCLPYCTYYPYYSCRQNCTTSTNVSKSLSYSTYTSALSSYNNAVSNYNKLVKSYNATLSKINSDINLYNTYQY